MKWYYADRGNPIGPVSEEEFRVLVESNRINSDTLVWRSGMADWQRLVEIKEEIPTVIPEVVISSQTSFCSECGRTFSHDEMIQYQGAWICADCKPRFVQKLREGIRLASEMEYAGFWIRFWAKSIDGIISSIVIYGFIGLLLESVMGKSSSASVMLTMALVIVQIVFTAGYTTWFVGKFGATPGKMICRIKIVNADGGKVTYGLALGRYFGEWISAILCWFGYLMVAFDSQKRALHDRICGTRVIKK